MKVSQAFRVAAAYIAKRGLAQKGGGIGTKTNCAAITLCSCAGPVAVVSCEILILHLGHQVQRCGGSWPDLSPIFRWNDALDPATAKETVIATFKLLAQQAEKEEAPLPNFIKACKELEHAEP